LIGPDDRRMTHARIPDLRSGGMQTTKTPLRGEKE
jgi:hypothetical protein